MPALRPKKLLPQPGKELPKPRFDIKSSRPFNRHPPAKALTSASTDITALHQASGSRVRFQSDPEGKTKELDALKSDPFYRRYEGLVEKVLKQIDKSREPLTKKGLIVADSDVTGPAHQRAVQVLIDTAMNLAVESLGPKAKRMDVINLALMLTIAARQENYERSQNLVLRDADHYFAGYKQEWQNWTLARVGINDPDEPRKFWSPLSSLASATYDFKKVISSMQTSKYPPSPPGGRGWAEKGYQQYLRDAEKMQHPLKSPPSPNPPIQAPPALQLAPLL